MKVGFIRVITTSAIVASEFIPKMTSLPQSVKDEFAKRVGAIGYRDHLAKVSIYGAITEYAPTAEDVLNEDWLILD